MSSSVPAMVRRPVAGLPAGPVADVVTASALAATALAGTFASSPDTSPVGLVLIGAMFLALGVRSARPVATALMVSVLASAVWWITEDDWHTALAGWIAFHGLGRRVDRPTSIRWSAAMVLFLVAAAYLQSPQVLGDFPSIDPVGGSWFRVVSRGSLVAGAFWLGDGQRSRDQLLASLRERAERAEEHRRVVERQAMLHERSRIARELHDVVAHSLSVMVVQATAAARLSNHDRDGSAAAMTAVAEVGRSAMVEMRQILGLLDGDRSLAPQPRLTDLHPLVDRYRSSGLTVTIDGPELLPELPAATELAVIRIIQEGLTNALKHAPGASVVVSIRIDPAPEHLVEVCVVDDGPSERAQREQAQPRTGPSSTEPTGRGLLGMRERVEALGGTLTTGPRPTGGFAVRARLPLPAAGDLVVGPPTGPPTEQEVA